MEEYLYRKEKEQGDIFKKSDVSCNHRPNHTHNWDCFAACVRVSLSVSVSVSVSVSPFSVQFVILETNFNL